MLLLLVLTSITLITLDERTHGTGFTGNLRSAARDAFAPVQSAAAKVLNPVGDFFGGLTHYGHLKSENARLRRELDDLRARGLQETDAERERREVLALEHLTFVGNVPRLAARVVSTSPSNFELTVEIDRGSARGVVSGMPVVTGAGLVGRVVEVSQQRATVLLLTDGQSSVGVRLTGSGDVGVAKGSGRNQPLSVDFVETGTKVALHEVVVTSGTQDSIYPPGIPVGTVRRAKVVAGALQQDVTIDPVVDLGRLEFVSVLLWTPPKAAP